ncbi:MAG: class I SAM-dependent methyltransferase, partial [Candidatus Hodarchaeales archaeon]
IFDILAPIYDTLIRGSTPDELIKLLNLEGNEKLLEIGAGTGRTVESIASLCNGLYLLDPSLAMLAKARKKIPCAKFRSGFAENLPFPNNFFHKVFAVDSFHHWNDHSKGVSETYRVLKKNGIFILFEFDPSTRFGHYLNNMEKFLRMGSRFFTPYEIRTLLKHKTKFKIRKQYYIDSMTYITLAEKIQ